MKPHLRSTIDGVDVGDWGGGTEGGKSKITSNSAAHPEENAGSIGKKTPEKRDVASGSKLSCTTVLPLSVRPVPLADT